MRSVLKKFTAILLSAMMAASASAVFAEGLHAEYTSLGVPNINSSWKTWMSWKCIESGYTPQGRFLSAWGWADEEGFMRAAGERDLGIEDDYYLVALGSYYGSTIGTKYRITLDTGRVFYAVLGDQKADCDTNWTHQYSPGNNDVVEFIVDVPTLNPNVKEYGTANVFMPLNGSVASVERIDFVY